MTGIDEATVDRAIAERSAEMLRDALDPMPLRWLALPPEWTLELALECDFPVDDGGLDELLDRAQELSLCKVRRERTIADRERIRFWVPTSERASLFEEWRRSGADLRTDLDEISARILGAPEEIRLKSAKGVLRWAELSQAELSARMANGEGLRERVADALDEGNSAVAAEWVRAGESLGWLLGGEMELAATRSRRRLQRHYREAQDARHLAEFVSREEQIEKVDELLGPSPQWAVHFWGQSGVGKTMLMIYLTNRVPVASTSGGGSGGPCPAARIDFDHVDPSFPLERPARLLVELADGLASHATTPAQEASYLAFEETVAAYEAARQMEAVEGDPLAAMRSSPFEPVVTAFAEFTKTLPSPVILILDTCEELAKLHPDGEDVPSVEAMFEIVEQVHKADEDVLVAFAGRRWLTPIAANMDRSEEATPPAVMSMKERRYLNMHPTLGFTRDDVITFLRDARGLSIDDAMVEAVLANTLDRGKPASLKDAGGGSDADRFKPTMVDLYSRWIESDPDLRPEDLASANHDAYVEVRIFKRIESVEVKAAIPAAMLLERFDWSMIEPALDIGAPHKALTGLVEQEWTHLEGGPEPEQMVISVDRGLLPPLREYFEHEADRQLEVEAARQALEPHLALLFERPTAEVRPDQIDAAIRVLDPEDAARLFGRLADRVAAERAWSWGESVCSLLLAPEREPELPGPLVASVCALYVGVLAQRGASADLTALRHKIIDRAPEHPDREGRWVLDARARLGKVASGAEVDPKAVVEALTRGRMFLKLSRAAVAPALLAAAEALIDAHEGEGREIPTANVRHCLQQLHRSFEDNRPVRAYLFVLEGRLRTAVGDRTRAVASFRRANHISLAGERRLGFVDWVAPASLHHRVLFELLRHRVSLGVEKPKFLDRCEAMALKGSGVDAGQLLSLVLQVRRARGELNERDLDSAARFEDSLVGYELTSFSHRCVPPLFASIAECLLTLGRPRKGLELLLERERRATARRTDEDTARAAALATLRILRRYRLRERYGLISNLSSSLDSEVRSEAMAAGALIAGLRPPRGDAGVEDHLAWRARAMLDPRGEEPTLAAISRRRDPVDERERLSMALDRFEAELVRRRWTLRGRAGVRRATREVEGLAGLLEEPELREPLGEGALRLRLRRSALLDQPPEVGTVSRWRRDLVARLAFEEGELMALRVPDRATRLLGLAEKLMSEERGDPYGAFFAALRGAIADIHAGRKAGAAAAGPRVFDRYDELREVEPELPSLADLRDGTVEPADLKGHPWHQWVWRLEVYRRWHDEKSTRERSAPPSFEPETELTPALGAGGIEVRAAVRRREPASQALSAFLLGIGAIGLAAGFRMGSVLSGFAAAAGLLGVAAAAGLIGGALSLVVFSLWQRIFGWGLRVDGYDLSLVLARRSPGSPPAVEALLEPWARKPLSQVFLRMIWRLPPRSRWTATIPLEEELVERPLPDSLRIAVGRRRRRGEPVVIRLLVSGVLGGVAWERWLLADRGLREGLSPDNLPSVWRIRSRDLLLLPADEWPTGVSLRAAPRWRPFIEASAAPGTEWHEREPDSGSGRVAIALGFPAFTRAGWRLRIDEDLTLGRTDPEAVTQELLSPDRLAAEAPIAIVVGRPAGDLAQESWSAYGLRAFANETSLAGARAVLVVPSLPAERTSEVIRIVTEAIGQWSEPPDREQLRGLASRLRWAAYEGAGGLDDEQRRARYGQALDVCLSMPS